MPCFTLSDPTDPCHLLSCFSADARTLRFFQTNPLELPGRFPLVLAVLPSLNHLSSACCWRETGGFLQTWNEDAFVRRWCFHSLPAFYAGRRSLSAPLFQPKDHVFFRTLSRLCSVPWVLGGCTDFRKLLRSELMGLHQTGPELGGAGPPFCKPSWLREPRLSVCARTRGSSGNT